MKNTYTFRHTIITMNRYAHTRRGSAVEGIKALDEAYNL